MAAPPAASAPGAELGEDPRFLQCVAPLASYLPLVAQLRLSATSRAWHAAQAKRYVTCVDLSPRSGVRVASVTDAVLRAACALTHGRLEELDVRGCALLTRPALAEVLAANAPTLRRVYVSEGGTADATCLLDCAHATALLATAPHLRVFEAHLKGAAQEAAALVQAAARLGALHVRFGVQLAPDSTDRTYDTIAMAANGIARAAREPGQAPQPRAPGFAGAVRASGDTTSFEFLGALHGQESAPTLLAALQAHPRVRVVELQLPADAFDETETADGDAHPLADALAALVAANSPTLQQLHVRTERALCDTDLAPLVEALLLNTHLTTLRCGPAGDVSEDFARRVLLPAVHGNASLRVLRICEQQESPALREAEALVQQRSGGA
jgi:hypothetical protein